MGNRDYQKKKRGRLKELSRSLSSKKERKTNKAKTDEINVLK